MVRHRSKPDCQEGRYTRDHILFEGADFEEWKAYIEGQLAKQKLLNQARAKKARMLQSPQGKKARSYILDHVDQRIQDRLDVDTIANIPQLFAKLKSQCKSFNLFGLPAELRNQIYSEVFRTQREQDIYICHTNDTGPRVPELPAILRTRDKISDEASSVYFAESTFVLYLGSEHFTDNVKRYDVAGHIEKWLETKVAEKNLKHLRRLKIEIEHAVGPGRSKDTRSMTFIASEAGELGFELTDSLGDLEQNFTRAISEINKKSKKEGWKGEVISHLVTEKKKLLAVAVSSIRNMRF